MSDTTQGTTQGLFSIEGPVTLPPTGKTRVSVASAGPDEEAIFMAEGDLSFGFHFFAHLHNGAGFYEAYKKRRYRPSRCWKKMPHRRLFMRKM